MGYVFLDPIAAVGAASSPMAAASVAYAQCSRRCDDCHCRACRRGLRV